MFLEFSRPHDHRSMKMLHVPIPNVPWCTLVFRYVPLCSANILDCHKCSTFRMRIWLRMIVSNSCQKMGAWLLLVAKLQSFDDSLIKMDFSVTLLGLLGFLAHLVNQACLLAKNLHFLANSLDFERRFRKDEDFFWKFLHAKSFLECLTQGKIKISDTTTFFWIFRTRLRFWRTI